jgi:hypothetical protein
VKGRGNARWRFVPVLWPVLGGAWGAWVGLGDFFQLPHNADSFGSFFASAYLVWFAAIGLVAGAALAVLIGGSIEWLLRRFGLGMLAAFGVASLASGLALWQVAELVREHYPGLRVARPADSRRGEATRTPERADRGSNPYPCSGPPPAKAGERATWDAECR